MRLFSILSLLSYTPAVIFASLGCITPSSTYNGTVNTATDTFETADSLSVYPCTCSYNGQTAPETYCLASDGGYHTIFRLVYQNDTTDYKWYPAYEQFIIDAASDREANPSCAIADADRTPVTGQFLPNGYSANDKFQLNSRCNIAATFCSPTGSDCIGTYGDDLQMTAFNLHGVPCNDNFNGEPFWGIADVLIQWRYYQYEQCWNTVDAIFQQSGSNRGGSEISGSSSISE